MLLKDPVSGIAINTGNPQSIFEHPYRVKKSSTNRMRVVDYQICLVDVRKLIIRFDLNTSGGIKYLIMKTLVSIKRDHKETDIMIDFRSSSEKLETSFNA